MGRVEGWNGSRDVQFTPSVLFTSLYPIQVITPPKLLLGPFLLNVAKDKNYTFDSVT